MKVIGTPKHYLATDRADVNSSCGRFVLWWEARIALAVQGDMNRSTGRQWTVEELYAAANSINRRIRPWWRRWR